MYFNQHLNNFNRSLDGSQNIISEINYEQIKKNAAL